MTKELLDIFHENISLEVGGIHSSLSYTSEDVIEIALDTFKRSLKELEAEKDD